MILLDTGPVVALCDPRDGLNRIALRDLERVSRDPLVLCTPVMTEVCFLLSHAVHRARLERMIGELSIRAYRDDDAAGLWGEVFRWMADYREHEPDWSDGYLAVISGKNRHCKLWTYDREFRTIWRRPDSTAIPLATRRS